MKCVKCGQEIMESAAFCPYCGTKAVRESAGVDGPLYQTEVKGMRKSGRLSVYRDRTEYATSSIQKTVYNYAGLAAVRKRTGVGTALGFGVDHIDFVTESGITESCPVNRKDIHEVFLRIKEAADPYLEERRERLLAQGIYLSGFGSYGSEKGILNMLEDRAEFTFGAGKKAAVFFRDVRNVNLLMGMLELAMTDGTSRSFAVEKEMQDAMFSYVREAIRPYVLKRTEGFDISFGIDERIEVNEERGVFHILRQADREITEECCLTDLVKCEQVECTSSKSALGFLAGAAKAAGVQEKLGAPDADDVISYVGVELTVRTEPEPRTELVRFGDFSLGMSRSNKKYEQYLAGIAGFMGYLEEHFPDCKLVVPAVPEPELIEMAADVVEEETEMKTGALVPAQEAPAAETDTVRKTPAAVNAVRKIDQLGIKKYIEGVTGFIDGCRTPMTIAVQGSGRSSIMKVLSESLEERYADNLIWFTPRLLLQSRSEEPLSVRVGKELIRRLSGTADGVSKDSAVKIAKGVIELLAGAIAPDSSAGQNLVEGLFKEGQTVRPEKVVEAFAGLVEKRTDSPDDKVIILINELDRIAPAKVVDLLEALQDYFECEGCVFVADIDYSFFQRGLKEHPGMAQDERQEKALFDEIFQMTFRIPVSGLQIRTYVKDKLEHMGIGAGDEDEAELDFYTNLITRSVGGEPKNMDRLFNSFLLIKNMADRELYENRLQRLMLFALLCMQTRFHAAYEQLKRMKNQMTPKFLSGLGGEDSEVIARSGLSGEEKKEFVSFARVICDIIDTDDKDGISEAECSVFARVLEVSGITSK